jgi:tRNA-specific 2-thiouridylase
VNWVSIERPIAPIRATVKIRHKHEPAPAMVEALEEARARIIFDTPQRAITPGQGAIFYDGDRVLGGSWIR